MLRGTTTSVSKKYSSSSDFFSQEVVKSIRIPYPCFTANKFTVKRSDYCQNPGCCSFEFVTSGILLSVGANII